MGGQLLMIVAMLHAMLVAAMGCLLPMAVGTKFEQWADGDGIILYIVLLSVFACVPVFTTMYSFEAGKKLKERWLREDYTLIKKGHLR